MKNYDKNIKEIDLALEGILGKIGSALKGMGKGLTRQSWTDADKESSGVEIQKDLNTFVQNDGSKELRDSMDNSEIESYKIGNNTVLEVSDSLIPFLYFDRQDDKEIADKQKTLNVSEDAEWLFDGSYRANLLDLDKVTTEGDGRIKDRMVRFEGSWFSGAFKGRMIGNSEISGGQIVDGIYASKPEGFKINPWDFISGAYMLVQGASEVMGLEVAKLNSSYKSLSLVQVPKNTIIKIVDNNDEEHLLNIEKSINEQSLDFKINGTVIPWNNYTYNKNNFLKTFMIVGKNFSIPGVISIDNGIQSIEVKTTAYKTKPVANAKNKPKNIPKDFNKFDIKTNIKGWNPSVKGGYKLDLDVNDLELINRVSNFKRDINNGNFFKYINYFKRLTDEGRIDGYGNFLSLSAVFPKKVGVQYKNPDSKRDVIMKYFSDFITDVIDNLVAQNVSKYYLVKLKEAMEDNSTTTAPVSKKSTKTKKTAQPTQKPTSRRATGSGIKNESIENNNEFLKEMDYDRVIDNKDFYFLDKPEFAGWNYEEIGDSKFKITNQKYPYFEFLVSLDTGKFSNAGEYPWNYEAKHIGGMNFPPSGHKGFYTIERNATKDLENSFRNFINNNSSSLFEESSSLSLKNILGKILK